MLFDLFYIRRRWIQGVRGTLRLQQGEMTSIFPKLRPYVQNVTLGGNDSLFPQEDAHESIKDGFVVTANGRAHGQILQRARKLVGGLGSGGNFGIVHRRGKDGLHGGRCTFCGNLFLSTIRHKRKG